MVIPLAAPAVVGLALGAGGCGAHTTADGDDAGPSAEVCHNGLDDDDDGLIDCDDPDCVTDASCLPPGCEPPTPELCEDGIDNDGNGSTDCDDQCCEAFCFSRDCPMCLYGVPWTPEPNETDCGDDFDSDCDGLIDCCDPDCDDAPECSGADSGSEG